MATRTTFLFAAILVGCSFPNAYGHGDSIHIREDKHKEDQHHHHADQTLAVNEDEQEKVPDNRNDGHQDDHDDHHDHHNYHNHHDHDDDHHHHHHHHDDHDDHDDGVPQSDAPSPALTGLGTDQPVNVVNPQRLLSDMLPTSVWGRAFAGTAFITAAGNAVILVFLYCEISPDSLNFLVAFAVGGMLGDVFLHLLPHAQGHTHGNDQHHGHQDHHDHHDHHDHPHKEAHTHTLADLTLGLSILTGLLVFFLLEKYLRSWSGIGHGHGHHHREAEDVPPTASSAPIQKTPRARRRKSTSKPRSTKKNKSPKNTHRPASSMLPWLVDLKPAALLNLCADALHNFTDGLAIAVACQASNALAVSTILAVAVHELPHEIGDFAILIKHGGFTKWGAFAAQWVSALGAFAGCFVGLQYGSEAPVFVVGFTAGGFIYISCVNIMPDMLQSGTSFRETLLQVVMMGLGVAMMIYVALYCE